MSINFKHLKRHLEGEGWPRVLDSGLTSDDMDDSVPDAVKDSWDELHVSWSFLMADADSLMDLIDTFGGAS